MRETATLSLIFKIITINKKYLFSLKFLFEIYVDAVVECGPFPGGIYRFA